MTTTPAIPSPQQLREGMVEDYAANARRAGGDVLMSDVERIVQADLQIYDAFERERRAAPPPSRAVPDEREDVAARVARERGMTMVRTSQDRWQDSSDAVLDRDPRQVSAKFPAMMARIKRIVAPRGDVSQRSLTKTLEELTSPKLAREFLNLFLCYRSPTMRVRGNPFLEVDSARDRARIFLRKVEDICDRSTGSMGPWWVK